MRKIVLPYVYAGNISYYAHWLQADECWLDPHEHYVKQTYRNRCEIAGPNGRQDLIIPVIKGKQGHKAMKDVEISYQYDWPTTHWRSLEAGYRRSPYFEYYEDALRPLFDHKPRFLIEFTLPLHEKILHLLKTEKGHQVTLQYQKDWEGMQDLRSMNDHASAAGPEYQQVFATRNPFFPDLSVLDLLFNEGPAAASFLRSVKWY